MTNQEINTVERALISHHVRLIQDRATLVENFGSTNSVVLNWDKINQSELRQAADAREIIEAIAWK